MYTIGDIVFIKKASAASMVHYGEKKPAFECPCHWRSQKGRVTRIVGNYVYVTSIDGKIDSAFHNKDLTLSTLE